MAASVVSSFYLFLLLFVGMQTPPEKSSFTADLRALGPDCHVFYAHLDLVELRRAARNEENFRKAITLNGDIDNAVKTAASESRLSPELITEIFGGAGQAGIWITAICDDELAKNRFLILIDHKNSQGVLSSLLDSLRNSAANGKGGKKPLLEEREGMKLQYAETEIHGFTLGRHENIWLAQKNGIIAAGSDLLLVQNFLLRAGAGKPAARAATAGAGANILTAEFNPQLFLNNCFLLFRRDQEELQTVSGFFDFPAWEKIELKFDTDKLNIAARMSAASSLTKALSPPEGKPRLASCMPDGSVFAAICRFGQPEETWRHIKSAMAQGLAVSGNSHDAGRLEAEILKKTGLDVEKDIVKNISEFGIAIPVLSENQKLDEENVHFLFESIDSDRASSLIERYMKSEFREEYSKTEDGAAILWKTRNKFKIAKTGKTVMCGFHEEKNSGAFDRILDTRLKNSSKSGALLAEKYPDATVLALFNPSILLKGKDAGVITAGLWLKSGEIRLQVDFDFKRVSTVLLGISEDRALQAKKDLCRKNLKAISDACAKYLASHGKYPPDLDKLLPYADAKTEILVSPLTGKPYSYCGELAGHGVGTVASKEKIVFAYDSVGDAADGGFAVFLDGHVEWMSREEISRAVGASANMLKTLVK